MDNYDLCEDCEHSIWYSYEDYSAKECGMLSGSQIFLDGCREDCKPYYDEEEECWTCNSYKMQVNES